MRATECRPYGGMKGKSERRATKRRPYGVTGVRWRQSGFCDTVRTNVEVMCWLAIGCLFLLCLFVVVGDGEFCKLYYGDYRKGEGEG